MPRIERGLCVAVPIRKGVLGAFRVIAIDKKHGPVLEGVRWFGPKVPSLEEIESASTLYKNDALDGEVPVRCFLIERLDRLPKAYEVVGVSKREFVTDIPLIPKPPNGGPPRFVAAARSGMGWDAIEASILEGWALQQRRDPHAEVTASLDRKDRELARRKGTTPAIARLTEEADDALGMWRRGEYDNLKDAILDARRLLAKARTKLPSHVPRLEKMLARATADLAALAARDRDIAAYAKGLLPKTRRQSKRKVASRA
jgi:hypothetical protein